MTGVRADGERERQPSGKLQQAVFAALVGTPGGAKIDPTYWMPLLKDRYKANPEKWQNLVLLLLQSAASNPKHSDDARSFLLALVQSTDESTSSQAYDILVRRYPDNDELTKLLVKLFHDKSHWISAVRWLSMTPKFPPEVIDSLLHGNQKQQADIRGTFGRAGFGPAQKQLVATMVGVLKDDSKSADHVAVIRALAALGRAGDFASSELPQLLNEIVRSGPLEKQVAAAFALQYATRDKTQAVSLLDGQARVAEGRYLDKATIQLLLNKEAKAFAGE